MKTVREELEILGPERVKLAMRSFDRTGHGYCFPNRAMTADETGLSFGLHHAGRELVGDLSAVEAAFEGWGHATMSNEELRQECIRFLAEHGTAIEREVSSVQPA